MVQIREMIEIAKETQEVYLYILTSTTKCFDELGRIEVYGIEVRCGKDRERIEDISLNKQVVLSLLEKIETKKCSLLHFKDVVEDFVIDYEI